MSSKVAHVTLGRKHALPCMRKQQAVVFLVRFCLEILVEWLLRGIKGDSAATSKHIPYPTLAAPSNLWIGETLKRGRARGAKGWAAPHAEWWLFEALVLLAGILPNPDQARLILYCASLRLILQPLLSQAYRSEAA